jgi:hypothetical protein
MRVGHCVGSIPLVIPLCTKDIPQNVELWASV